MLFRLSLAVATFVATVLAQGSLSFTSVPTSVNAGQTYDITWTGGDSTQPVTITLRSGDPNNLQTVGTITTTATGGSYQWTPDTTIADGSQYALQISQGTDVNYSGEFSITGGSAASASASQASVISSAVSVQSSLASMASSAFSSASSALSSQSASMSSMSMTTSASSSATSSSKSSSSSSSSASKTSSSSSSSAAPSSNAGANFNANQAVLALGAVAAALI